MEMKSNITIRTLLHDLWRQHPAHPTTFGDCHAKGCDNRARGSELCPDCLIKAATRLIGEEHRMMLIQYNELILRVRRLESELEDIYEANDMDDTSSLNKSQPQK